MRSPPEAPAKKRSVEQAPAFLLENVLLAQEEERRRIARDLHDEIGQSLTALLVGLRAVIAAPTLEVARGRAEELRRIAATALDEVGRLARGLRPHVLDDLGLLAAIECHAKDFARAPGIAVEVKALGQATQRLPEAVETALYRIVQEALTNAARHARALHVEIIVERRPWFVRVSVADDGRGFDSQASCAGDQFGLSGMRERAGQLRGRLTVEPRPGRGTRITVLVPLTEEPHGQCSRAPGG